MKNIGFFVCLLKFNQFQFRLMFEFVGDFLFIDSYLCYHSELSFIYWPLKKFETKFFWRAISWNANATHTLNIVIQMIPLVLYIIIVVIFYQFFVVTSFCQNSHWKSINNFPMQTDKKTISDSNRKMLNLYNSSNPFFDFPKTFSANSVRWW